MKGINKGISIIVCTFNGQSRLAYTLLHLSNQKLQIPCEIILVDNASTDGTKSFADDWWEKNGVSHMEYRSLFQSIPGKSYAQEMAYGVAKYSYLLICDDDNWLSSNYVQAAYDIMEQDENIGALGGWCEAEFEGEKPQWFDTYAKYYAVSKQGKKSGDITNKKGCLYGAGMVIRRSHWLQLRKLGFNPLLTCRKGETLSSGGDTEYCYALRLLGYKIWYDERLYFRHFMSQGRLNLKYLSRLRKAMSFSNFVLWPYLDLLKGSYSLNRKEFISYVMKGFPVTYSRGLKGLFGGYEAKEKSKNFFRNQWYYMFGYNQYKFHLKQIQNWQEKTGLKNE